MKRLILLLVLALPLSAADHAYWRVIVTAIQSGSNLGIAELQFHTSVGGAQAATGGTALSSGDFGGFPASNAFDGNATTSWVAGYPGTSDYVGWIGYQFASAVSIVEISIAPRTSGLPGSELQGPSVFKLEYSDNGSTWTTLAQMYCTTFAAPPTQTTRTWSGPWSGGCAAGACRWWRINTTSTMGSTSYVGLVEVQFRASVGGADVAVDGGAESQSVWDASYVSVKAFDDSAATAWVSVNGGPLPQWIVYNMAATDVKQVALTARSNDPVVDAPIGFTLEGSNDGLTFSTRATFATTADWTPGETRLFGVSPVKSRRPMRY